MELSRGHPGKPQNYSTGRRNFVAESVTGIKGRVLKVLEGASAEAISTGFGNGGDVGDAAVLGGIQSLADFDFFDSVE